MLKFDRVDSLLGVNVIYAAPGMRPGRYRVVSVVSSWWCGVWCVVGYVVRWRGRLVRCWAHWPGTPSPVKNPLAIFTGSA